MKFRISFLALFLMASLTNAADILVSTPQELKSAAAKAKPGDVILLKNKVWTDVQLVISGKGTKEKPIWVKPESGDKIEIAGKSNLKIGGEYVFIKGLHFKNGYSPKDHLINFRVDNNNLANNCRITQFAIEDFSQPERFKGDSWVVLWGKNNRVDHCTFTNKLNAGPVIIAELNDERSQQNYHRIDSNHFNGRQRFGSNGGETIRIGVSRYSLTASKTQIVHNLFERCNGEVEIVSIKSGENNISFNTFLECEGSLVLRHGSKNVVQGNLFLGNNKPFTGGVRVINPGHEVFENVFKDLKGTAFRSPLAVMNGVPNSLINRYYQVVDAKIERNTFINCEPSLFGTGKDAERTLSPQRVVFTKNLLVQPTNALYIDENKDGGIVIKDNALQSNLPVQDGFVVKKPAQVSINGISFPYLADYGASLKKMKFVHKKDVGASWYKQEVKAINTQPKIVKLSAKESTSIQQTIAKLTDGDIIELTDTGLYSIEDEIVVDKSITIKAAAGLKSKPVFVNSSSKTLAAFITIDSGATVKVTGIAFKGANGSGGDVRCGIRSTELPMNKPYKAFIDACEFYDYNEGSFAGFKGSKSTLADSLVITNSLFRNISGTGINLAEERDDKGIYGAEYTVVKNCVFTNILGSAINVYRGGNDESTLGPFVTIENCTINEVDNREQGSALRLLGAQYARVLNTNFVNSGQGGRSLEFREFRWDNILVDNCNFYNSGKVDTYYNKALGKNIFEIKPDFTNTKEFNFNLKEGSELSAKSKAVGGVGASL
ncbi:chondroitinase-B domain-containing protein [Pedobacter xixiisoli]|uniref:Poly(Beta-D-mannuronate) lyase n=1 Tax=Pedobacter xixiisoli TaxID=1476464 RepID=A0A285ZZ22_9SPHI|nr:chondroitinase-B domain-containing protein [Pedobacter xixiisoli]SOD14899.1 poly(beta-D-mannuronate) lyase [Pedobacter xixiisoli]